MGRQTFGTHMVYRETFLQIQRRLFQQLIRRSWIHGVLIYQSTHHHLWWVKIKTPVQDERCQSGPSAKDSVIFSEGEFSKNYGTDQQRLQISDLHFDKFSTPATFACWKIRFKTEVCVTHKNALVTMKDLRAWETSIWPHEKVGNVVGVVERRGCWLEPLRIFSKSQL